MALPRFKLPNDIRRENGANITLYVVFVFCYAELTIDNRVDSAKTTDDERKSSTDSKAAENKAVKSLNHSGSINLGSSQYEVDSSQYDRDSQPVSTASTCAPLSPGSASIRHSASDSLVYRAEAELPSLCQMLAECPHSEQVAGSAGLNGYCKAVEETCVSQVRLVQIVKFIYRVSMHPGKSGIFPGFYGPWKAPENRFFPGRYWKMKILDS